MINNRHEEVIQIMEDGRPKAPCEDVALAELEPSHANGATSRLAFATTQVRLPSGTCRDDLGSLL
jgi:hypothetical protein